ncbi:hypothetical protein [Halococcus saccharolyticus]|uniref:Uncharacterized protein n=1 Tax=Halococcus saccharolyticus DSM 5350 TaxID=1227455 RepID=M0MQJ6_9EURY|nr:hypothetical protein [Halococcus saccharolyticus]EMA47608.1 hypothetical protein C449_01057 [Halococcus saccharolyticus DSM 5350]
MLEKLKRLYWTFTATLKATWWQHNHGDEMIHFAENALECEQCGGAGQDFRPEEMCNEHREQLDEFANTLPFE